MVQPSPTAPAPTYDIFLSHSQQDAEIVQALARWLEDDAGLTVWLDRWALVPGGQWIHDTEHGLDQAHACATCVGAEGTQGWFRQEIDLALHRQAQDPSFHVIPVLLPGAREGDVAGFLDLRTRVDLRRGLEDADALRRLVRGIQGLAPGRDGEPELVLDARGLPAGSRMPFVRNALFTGRVEALAEMARVLLYEAAPTALITQAISGMGGVGKTQLAVEFAYRYGRFFRGVHWLNAAQPGGLDAEVAACGEEMALPNWPDERPEQVRHTLQEWKRGGLRLVVLDNLEDVQAAREWLPRLAGGGVRVLITARRGRWPRDLGLERLSLEVFSPGESLAFLRRYLPGSLADAKPSALASRKVTDDDLAALAERLGHLPLAEELAGRYLEVHPRLSVSDYLARLNTVLDDPAMQAWREELGNPTGHDLDLARTFALSWEQIEDEVGLTVWLDQWTLVPGEPWRRAMARGLDEAGSCVVCVGGETPRGWFDEEIGRALSIQVSGRRYRVIPVLLPGADPSYVDAFLELRTWVDFRNGLDDADAFHRLVSGIRGVPPGRGPRR